MINKIKNVILYTKAFYRGEIFKRLEYKIKDSVGYFYIRNKIQQKDKNYSIDGFKINFNLVKINNENIISDEYKIFKDKIKYKDIINFLNVDNEFWRKNKLKKYEDVKIIWEYNRLQYLLPLTINYITTKDEKYKKSIEEILDFWAYNNPFEYTLNWNSNLEVAIRAINIGLSLILLKDDKLNKKYSKLIYLHGTHIYNEINYSEKCIPNNHLIGEAVALLFLSNILKTKENKKWYKKSIKLIKKHIHIIEDNGFSKENSFSYQFFVTKMYILSLCFIKEKELFEKINKKVTASLKVLNFTIFNDNQIINYGDNDDGFLFSTQADYNVAKDIKQYYNLFFEKETSNETRIYQEIQKHYNKSNQLIFEKRSTDKYVLTNHNFIYKNQNNILFFNAKPIVGHAHNDSLAINLIINDKEILLDAGTYSYNKDVKHREYFRSRDAHTTILFEERNAIQVGTFRWINKKDSNITWLEENKDYIKLQGEILDICKRKIIIYKNKNEIKITDEYSYSTNPIMTNWIVFKEAIKKKNKIHIGNTKIEFNTENIECKKTNISRGYLSQEEAKTFKVICNEELNTKISWE